MPTGRTGRSRRASTSPIDVGRIERGTGVAGPARHKAIFRAMRIMMYRRCDRMFAWLLFGQWVFAIALALAISPWSYEDGTRTLHLHVKIAVGLGALINVLPIALVYFRPGWWVTRQSIAIAQMVWSAMLILVTHGRVETHFHILGSLAFLAFYRDWKLLLTATIVTSLDHFVRGAWWPESLYGMVNPEWWRPLEHVGWIVFVDIVLVFVCVYGVRDLREAARREGRLERMKWIVERKVDERTLELQDSIQRYRSLVEGTAAVPFELAANTFKVIYIAPQITNMLCPNADLDDPDLLLHIVHADDRDRVWGALVAFAGGHPASDPIDFRLSARRGREIFARTLLSACEDGRIRGVIIDITRQRKLELELQQAQKLESVGRLAAGVAHEINTPVQFVSDSVQFARDAITDVLDIVAKQQAALAEQDPGRATELADEARAAIARADLPYVNEELPRALDRAVDGLERVATIVRSMKVFAHPGNTGVSAFDLNKAVESTLTIAQNEYRYVADVETTYGDLPRVVGHGNEVNQAILNVVLNAAHAVGDAVKGTTARGRISVRTACENGHVVLSIADTGGGIPEEVRRHIFDPFFTTKPLGRGTGQGLAIAHSIIVDKHHGTLTFDTEVGVGTTFHIRIPVARPPEAHA